jgi:hypothetical protein
VVPVGNNFTARQLCRTALKQLIHWSRPHQSPSSPSLNPQSQPGIHPALTGHQHTINIASITIKPHLRSSPQCASSTITINNTCVSNNGLQIGSRASLSIRSQHEHHLLHLLSPVPRGLQSNNTGAYPGPTFNIPWSRRVLWKNERGCRRYYHRQCATQSELWFLKYRCG